MPQMVDLREGRWRLEEAACSASLHVSSQFVHVNIHELDVRDSISIEFTSVLLSKARGTMLTISLIRSSSSTNLQ
jgi:hypothetical protein